MTQCVPSWPIDGSLSHLNLVLSSLSNNSFITDAPEMDYEVAELTWENGQPVMHGLGPARVLNKPLSTCSPAKYTCAGGTLESLVNQATSGIPHPQKSPMDGDGDKEDDFARWFDNCLLDTQTPTMAVDALVPTSSTNTPNSQQEVPQSIHPSKCVRVASCSGDAKMGSIPKDFEIKNLMLYEGHNNTTDQTVKQRDTIETDERELGVERLTAASMGSPENTSKHCNSNRDFISRSKTQRVAGIDEHKDGDEKKGSKISSLSTKKSRAAATHNQSERKRRDRINQRMKTLQKLVPNSSKRIDKASMLDEVIEYLKQLQAQVKAMSRMVHVNMPPSPMMLPNMALQQQQQLQMSMMGLARPMDVNALNRPNITTIPSVPHPAAPANFNMPMPPPGASLVPDPLATFLPAAQSQPMRMDAYGRMAAFHQQYLRSNANLGFKN